jgi:hypothetical protein
MRAAGLRFSTLGTSRHRVAYLLYRRLGYEDAARTISAIAQRHTALGGTHLRAERANPQQLPLADGIFRQVAAGKLGFARRHEPFIPALVEIGDLGVDEVWLLWSSTKLIGYAVAKVLEAVLTVSDLLLGEGIDAASAVSAITRETTAAYVRVTANCPCHMSDLQRAGYQLTAPDWGTFMVKSLTTDMTIEAVRSLFGIGTEQCLMSWMDMT